MYLHLIMKYMKMQAYVYMHILFTLYSSGIFKREIKAQS